MISANATLSCLATFECNFGGDAFLGISPSFLPQGFFSPVPRKLTACTRFGFLEKVAFYVLVLWALYYLQYAVNMKQVQTVTY